MVDNTVASGDEQNPSGNPVDIESPSEQSVSYETHRKLLGQRKRDQVELDTLRSFKTTAESADRLKEEQGLAAKGEFTKINASKDARIKELEAINADRDRLDAEAKKVDAVLRLVGPLKRREYAAHIDVDSILVDPATGLVDEHSLKEASDKFSKEYADLIQTRQDIPTLPTGTPGRPLPGKTIDNMTVEELKLLVPDLMQAKLLKHRQT